MFHWDNKWFSKPLGTLGLKTLIVDWRSLNIYRDCFFHIEILLQIFKMGLFRTHTHTGLFHLDCSWRREINFTNFINSKPTLIYNAEKLVKVRKWNCICPFDMDFVLPEISLVKPDELIIWRPGQQLELLHLNEKKKKMGRGDFISNDENHWIRYTSENNSTCSANRKES